MHRIRKYQKLLKVSLVLMLLTISCSETADWMASRFFARSPFGKNCVVLVLGYPSHNNGQPSPVQITRTLEGVHSYQYYHCELMVISGSAVKNHIVEAQTMSIVAKSRGVPSTSMILETKAQNTWENIKFSTSILEKYDNILIVSDNLHAQRGRRYLCKQRPDLCDRTFVAVRYRPFYQWSWKIPAALYELFTAVRDLILF
jgi:uncharacterized SAM-binding protein YcdF (DUF218 family)